MKKNIYFVRHAEGLHNVNNEWFLENPRLTEKGVNQCIENAKNFLDIKIDVVLVSPLIRTLQTASLLFPNTKNIIANENVRECMLNPCDRRENIDKYKEEFKNIDFSKIDNNDPFENIDLPEKLPHILSRCKKLEEYLKNCEFQNIVIVSHWAFIFHYMKYFKKKNNIQLENCQFIKFQF